MPNRCLLVAIFGLTVSGCGTVLNIRDIYVRDPSYGTRQSSFQPGLNPAPKMIYGGVQLDAVAGKGWLEESRDDPRLALMAGYVWLVDLPVSAVADTLTLPITISHSIRGRESKESVLPPYYLDLE